MINLLPLENRKQIRASFYNVVLGRLILIFLVATLIIGMIFGLSYMTLQEEEQSLANRVKDINDKSSSFNKVKKESEQIAKDLESAKSIFDEQKHYSVFLADLAKSLPEDVAISDIIISPNILKKPAVVTIRAVNDNKIIETKRKMEESNLIELISIDSIITAKDNDDEIKNSDPLRKTATLSITFSSQGLADSLKWQSEDLTNVEKRREKIRAQKKLEAERKRAEQKEKQRKRLEREQAAKREKEQQ